MNHGNVSRVGSCLSNVCCFNIFMIEIVSFSSQTIEDNSTIDGENSAEQSEE